jgi:manganese/zinc/iron transport system permease protein
MSRGDAAIEALRAWTPEVDGWIIAIGALAAIACAVPGTLLVARRQSMAADGIAHAVLPGIAGAFLLSGTRDLAWMAGGAAVAAVAMSAGSAYLERTLRVERDAALGIAYTVLFALGLALVVRAADGVDIDPSCVLFGAIEFAPLDRVQAGGHEVPRAAIVIAAAAAANVAVAALAWRPILASSFDRSFACAAGARPAACDAVVGAMATATCVACFESLGSVIVVGMLVVPACAARLACVRLVPMAMLAATIGCCATALGHVAACVAAPIAGLDAAGVRELSTAGCVAASLGACFAGVAWVRAITMRKLPVDGTRATSLPCAP